MAMLGETAFGVAAGNDEALDEFDEVTEVCEEGAKVL